MEIPASSHRVQRINDPRCRSEGLSQVPSVQVNTDSCLVQIVEKGRAIHLLALQDSGYITFLSRRSFLGEVRRGILLTEGQYQTNVSIAIVHRDKNDSTLRRLQSVEYIDDDAATKFC